MPGTGPATSSVNISGSARLAEHRFTRRDLLLGGVVGLGVLALSPTRPCAQGLPEETRAALDQSPFVYISPLRSDGEESRCHGEVWFAFDRGSVLIVTEANTWKSRALAAGLDRVRIWVGDFGPVRRAGERFRSAPVFTAKAAGGKDDAAFERLLSAFGKKYPAEWDRWESRFRRGYADDSRVLIRYEPIGA